MRWRALGALLGAILLGAVVFSMWPSTPPPPELDVRPPPPVAIAAPVAAAPPVVKASPLPSPAPVAAPTLSPTAPPSPAPQAPDQLDPEVDPDHLRALGLGPEDVEPLDGGPLHALTRDGIKSAVTEELPGIRECYQGWLQQNPALGGKLKVEFTIAEIPGRARGKVMRVDIPDGGMGHVAMEGCVRNVFKGMRFEAPKNGEMRVTYPLTFAPTPRP